MTLPLSNAELLAVSVLKGHTDAVWPLIDELMETRTAIRLPPLARIEANLADVRVVAFLSSDADPGQVDVGVFRHRVLAWLRGEEDDAVMVVCGIDRVEVYAIAAPPEREEKT